MGEVKRKRASTIIDGIEPYEVKEGEEYMNDAQREHFRKILTAWRNQLREEVGQTVDHMKNEAANFPDEVDRASIRKIEKTLSTIDSDDFGYCKNCGSEIGIRRLEARPTADLCVDCKELAEIKEKQLSE